MTHSLREWVKQQAADLDVEEEHLLFNSKSRDPMWKGTDADHRNAEWFAKYWQTAVGNRSEDTVHVRGVHYMMIEAIDEPIESPSGRTSWTHYQNTTTCYNYLKDASVVARILGYVPLDGIRDEENDETVVTDYSEHTLDPTTVASYDDPPDGINHPPVPDPDDRASLASVDDKTGIDATAEAIGRLYASGFREYVDVDTASQQPYHVEIWSEKTPPAVLHDLAEQHGVNVVVTGQGDLSYQTAYNLSRRVNRAEKPAVILYLSDFDPKGDNMATAMAGKISWLKRRDELHERVVIKQLAVTADQIERHGLPRTPIEYTADPTSAGEKAYETLVDDWEQRKGHGATELQSLWRDEQRLVEEIEPILAELHDGSIDDAVEDAIDEWEAELAGRIADSIRNEVSDDRFADVEGWVRTFNTRLQEAADAIEDLNDLLEHETIEWWQLAVEDAIDDADHPTVDAPAGDGDLPTDPLYDSERGYFENIVAARDHENGER